MPHAAGKNKTTQRWVARVKTESTYPRAGLFTRSARTIARELASRRVSPRGPSSGMRMLVYYINRGGSNLTPGRKAVLEKAKSLLSQIIKKTKKNKT
jgi:hypothetical protein